MTDNYSQNKSNWCNEPWKNIYLQQAFGEAYVSPCCVSTPVKVDSAYSINEQPGILEIRKEFEQNLRPKACEWCWSNEDKGITSRRQSTGQGPKQDLITNFEIHTGNYCNLKCVICKSHNSSSWYKDSIAMGLPTVKNYKNKFTHLLDVSSARWIHFNGGEPLLTEVHIDVLNRVENKSECSVYYNTNATLRVDNSIFDLWSEFKLVQLIFSIDDVGERFNYQRTNANWDEVQSNMFWYRDHAPVNMMFGINRTISQLNQPYLKELNEWFANSFPTNRLGDPNDFTEQLATGHCALGSKTFNSYIENLNSVRQVTV